MDYKLCSKILVHKHCTDDVKELILLYKKQHDMLSMYHEMLSDKTNQIKILEAENKILKENSN